MNNARSAGNRLIVIFIDNDMWFAPPVGALSAYLAQLISSGTFISVREGLRKIARRMPRPLHIAARKADEFARGLETGGTLFEELGFYYVGPVGGRNLGHMPPVLETVRDETEGTVLAPVGTKK